MPIERSRESREALRAVVQALGTAREAGEWDAAAVLDELIGALECDRRHLGARARSARKWMAELRRMLRARRGDRGPKLTPPDAPPSRFQALEIAHVNLDLALQWEWEIVTKGRKRSQPNPDGLPAELAARFLRTVAANPLTLDRLRPDGLPGIEQLTEVMRDKLDRGATDAKALLSACLRSCGVKAPKVRDALRHIEHVPRHPPGSRPARRVTRSR